MVEFKMLMVAGSQTIKDKDYVWNCLDEIYKEYKFDTIVEGGAIGVNELAHTYAISHKFNHFTIYPNWEKYGRSAGVLRGKDLVEVANQGIAIWDGKSPGTKHEIKELKEKGKLLKVFVYEKV